MATAAAQPPSPMLYIGRIAPTVDNEFMLSLLQLCGNIKSWKRPQDVSTGTPKSFGFYEFESAEGVLRAMRLLSKLNVDGQQLLVNVNEAVKQYLEQYVQRKTENSNKKETQTAGDEIDDKGANFGIVTDEDREADRDALEKITKMIEERLKTRVV
ncbi:RNA-binding motif protein 25-like [Lotus japonicus]|uniref:RNA-binding motif protein 25-like n=1 Tax=Lotus japonicus TaxID=34305 RepID=UPI0025904545|nr:RNA-binding motif protein 25-like [Lotus japonicus]